MHMREEVHFVEITPPLTWRAWYKDGSWLDQYNPDGTKNIYNDLDREDLVRFDILDKATRRLIVAVHLDAKKKLIWRMRVTLRLAKRTKERVHLVGWQQRHHFFFKKQIICAIFGDGHVEIIDGFKKDHPNFYPVIFREAERL